MELFSTLVVYIKMITLELVKRWFLRTHVIRLSDRTIIAVIAFHWISKSAHNGP